VVIRLGLEEEDRYVVVIEDDGKGFVPSNQARGIGLIGIEERVAEMGGILKLSSKPGVGTRIHVSIPRQAANQPDRGAAAALSQPHENPIG
jgi:signal transduction histidine kinase